MATTNASGTIATETKWKDILAEILPPQGEWTEEQYLVLTDHRNRLIEFTDGFLEILPMPTDKHQSILKFLFFLFFQVVEGRGGTVQFAPLPLQVRPSKFREPDLMLFVVSDGRTPAGSFLARCGSGSGSG
jgi:Uma2 family endonuclease